MLLAFNQYPIPYNNMHKVLTVNILCAGGGNFMY
ncbi:hypothetical protein BcellWH2_00197 [Bacteroides cellulosilyticus]|uniref:Uncharacterized protein n=1 Tax=Bacteroides cellulosilyticus TaxID=246787 RepID=A0A0P0GC98_9BACE|nr:hypothetical protein BcellWH2_00197 [Bacteroides cellulosilyticus]